MIRFLYLGSYCVHICVFYIVFLIHNDVFPVFGVADILMIFGVFPVIGVANIWMIFDVFPVFGVASGHKRSIIVVEVPLAAAVDDVVTRDVISLFVMYNFFYLPLYIYRITKFDDIYCIFPCINLFTFILLKKALEGPAGGIFF